MCVRTWQLAASCQCLCQYQRLCCCASAAGEERSTPHEGREERSVLPGHSDVGAAGVHCCGALCGRAWLWYVICASKRCDKGAWSWLNRAGGLLLSDHGHTMDTYSAEHNCHCSPKTSSVSKALRTVQVTVQIFLISSCHVRLTVKQQHNGAHRAFYGPLFFLQHQCTVLPEPGTVQTAVPDRR